MSDLRFTLRPQDVGPSHKCSLFIGMMGAFISFVGMLTKFFMLTGNASCRLNGRHVPCSEIWWLPWCFVGFGILNILLALIVFMFERKISNNNRRTYYHCYTDRIERHIGTQQKENYYMTPDVSIYLLPQTRAQGNRNVGSIVVIMPPRNGLLMKDIPSHKAVYQQLCDLYHLNPENNSPPYIPIR